MGQIFVTTYEVNPEGMPIMLAHVAAVDAFHKRGLAVSDRYGATGFRPCRHASPRSLMFKAETAPAGFKLVKRERDGVIECAPRMSTALGKEAKAALDGIGTMPSGEDLAQAFGWSPTKLAMDTDRGTIYFPTTLSLAEPVERHFVRLPRFAEDEWAEHPGLTPIAESEFMHAIEQHNAAVRELKAMAA